MDQEDVNRSRAALNRIIKTVAADAGFPDCEVVYLGGSFAPAWESGITVKAIRPVVNPQDNNVISEIVAMHSFSLHNIPRDGNEVRVVEAVQAAFKVLVAAISVG